jgi:hypothetical protein
MITMTQYLFILLAFLAFTFTASANQSRSTTAARLRLALKSASQHGPDSEERLGLLLPATEFAIQELGSDAFSATLAQSLLDARWRSLTDRDAARRRLEDELARAVADLEFSPVREAELPFGFPSPTLVREIELKSYPRYRLARTDVEGARGMGAFSRLFGHIQAADISMTAPVEMTYSSEEGRLREEDMAFLYSSPALGAKGMRGAVEVLDVEPATVVSIGCRGEMTSAAIRAACDRLTLWIAMDDSIAIDGELRTLGYNSPMVARDRRYFEVQIPVRVSLRRSLFDFGAEGAADAWDQVDDAVMGGRSSSGLRSTGESTCVFTGRVSMENNGGFASVRREVEDGEIGGAEALILRFRGDGKTYKLRLRMTGEFSGLNYEASFSSENGVWTEREFLPHEFEPKWRGQPVRSAPRLQMLRVAGIGLMISDKQLGHFRLELADLFVR